MSHPFGFLTHRIGAPVAVLATLTLSTAAHAAGAPLRADLVEAKSVKIDGIPKEWSGGFLNLTHAVRGRAGKADLSARGLVAYDATHVFVAADVTDDVLRSGADRVELVLGFPGGAVQRVALYPGEPGKRAAFAKMAGKVLRQAKVVEAPRQGGYSLEAAVPWSVFEPAKTLRLGLHGALYVHDADASAAIETVVGTASAAGTYGALPPIHTESEQALIDGLLRDKGVRSAPNYRLFANVAGGALQEEVLIYDRYFVVLGPGFRKGSEYYWNDMGIAASAGQVPGCETRDVTGDGRAEIIFRKRFGTSSRYREIVQVISFGTGETPRTIFQHEIGLTTEAGSISNPVGFVPDGAGAAIVVQAGMARGFHAGNYHEKTETAFPALLLPWGTVQSRTYKLRGGSFVQASETRQAATPAPVVSVRRASLPQTPPAPDAGALLQKVHAAYKRDRRAFGMPRFDFAVDVAEDSHAERVLLHGRDIVIFGKAYKRATGYSYLTLSQFASPNDIVHMTARDLTGDGKAEIIVKGIQRAKAPKELGIGTLDREVMIVFQVSGGIIKKIFAAETGLSMGRKRITSGLRFVPAGKSTEIEIAPGKAVEWSESSFPFSQDTSSVGGFEPLLLPWGGNRAVRYKWTGSVFSR